MGVQFSLRISPATSFNMKIILALFGSFFTASSLPAPNGCPSILSPSDSRWPLCSGGGGAVFGFDEPLQCGRYSGDLRFEQVEDCSGPGNTPGPEQERIERRQRRQIPIDYRTGGCEGSICREYQQLDQLNQRVLDWEAENCCKRTDSFEFFPITFKLPDEYFNTTQQRQT